MMIFESIYFWVTLVILLYFMSIYWIIPKIENLEGNALRTLNSIVSGVTISFLFLYVLPDLYMVFNYIVAHVSESHAWIKSYLGHLISLVFLIGFTLHYITEKLSQKQCQQMDWENLENQTDHESNFESFAFYFNMVIWGLFHFCIMFVLPSIVTASLVFTSFFIVVLGLHFFLDQHVRGGYLQGKHQYLAKTLMTFSLLSGWGLGLTMIHREKPFGMSLVGAFIAGMMFMSFLKMEVQSHKKQPDMLIFLSSLVLSGIVILLLVSIEKKIFW